MPTSRICFRRYAASAIPPKNNTSKSRGRPVRSVRKSRSPIFTGGVSDHGPAERRERLREQVCEPLTVGRLVVHNHRTSLAALSNVESDEYRAQIRTSRTERISWRRHEIRLGPIDFRGKGPRNSAHRV